MKLINQIELKTWKLPYQPLSQCFALCRKQKYNIEPINTMLCLFFTLIYACHIISYCTVFAIVWKSKANLLIEWVYYEWPRPLPFNYYGINVIYELGSLHLEWNKRLYWNWIFRKTRNTRKMKSYEQSTLCVLDVCATNSNLFTIFTSSAHLFRNYFLVELEKYLFRTKYKIFHK